MPSGYTNNPEIRFAKSIMDYIFRWLGLKFLGPEYGKAGDAEEAAPSPGDLASTEPEPQQKLPFRSALVVEDAPTCSDCGSLMTRNGSCYSAGTAGPRAGAVEGW